MSTSDIHTCHDQCPRLECVQRREIERLKDQLSVSTWLDDQYGEPQYVTDLKAENTRLRAFRDAVNARVFAEQQARAALEVDDET